MKTGKKEGLKMIRNHFIKCVILFSFILFQPSSIYSQSLVYDNFDGTKSIRYIEKSGVLDTLSNNPSPNNINSSKNCALYVRNGSKKFDNIKMLLPGELFNVDTYATYLNNPPKISMKVYTSAPVGTLIEILLGSRGRNNEYPAGTNSQYQANTTVSNAWEEVQFKFSQIPQGSETSTTQVNQITLLFNPNSLNSDTYYFDELTGPPLALEKLKSEGATVNSPKIENTK